MITSERLVYRPQPYEGEVGALHVPTMEIEVNEAQLVFAQREWERYHNDGRMTDYTESVRGLHAWGDTYTQMLPSRLDLALDVDGAGTTQRTYDPAMSTRWIEVDEGEVYLRFSQARTARHGTTILRSPVMDGIAIESTTDPESLDIRDAHTMLIIEKARDQRDLSWESQSTKPAQVFDMSEFMDKPLHVGPLYSGHPNLITSKTRLNQIVRLGLDMLSELRKPEA